MAFRHPFFEFDPFEEILFNAFKAEPERRSLTSKSDSTVFPRYRAVSDHNAMVLEVELPGVDRQTIELDVNKKHITVAAKRPVWTGFGSGHETNTVQVEEVKESGAVAHETNGSAAPLGEKTVSAVRAEDHTMKYFGKFKLGYDVNVSAVTAEFKEGILRVCVPRHKEAKTFRRVEITM